MRTPPTRTSCPTTACQWFPHQRKRLIVRQATGSLSNGVLLAPYRAFGSPQTAAGRRTGFRVARGGVWVHPIANAVVFSNRKSQESTFFFKLISEEGVTALGLIHRSAYCYLAYAVRNRVTGTSIVRLCRTPKRQLRTLPHSHLPSTAFTVTALAFSSNEKMVYTFAEAEEGPSVLSLFSVETGMLLDTQELADPLLRLDTFPSSKSGVVGLARSGLTLFSYKRKICRLIARDLDEYMGLEKPGTPEQMVAFCQNVSRMTLFKAFERRVMVYVRSQLTQTIRLTELGIPQVPHDLPESEVPVLTAIASFSTLLLLALEGVPWLLVLQAREDGSFRFRNAVQIRSRGTFVRVAGIEVPEDKAVVGLQVLFRQGSVHDGSSDDALVSGFMELDAFVLEAINYSSTEAIRAMDEASGFTNAITGAGLSACNDLLALVSKDQTLRIINFVSGEEVSAAGLARPALCVDMHPSGLQLAVGFREGLKVFFVSTGTPYEATERVGKECRSLAYSQRGDMLAATSGNQVLVLDPCTVDCLATLSVFMTDIRQVFWRGNDTRLVALCRNGNVFAWSSVSWEKEVEFYPPDKSVGLLACDYDPVLDLFVYSTAAGRLAMAYDRGSIELINESMGQHLICALVILRKHKTLFAGTQAGAVLMLTWPLALHKMSLEYLVTPLHEGTVARLLPTPDGERMVTVSEDAAVFVSRMIGFLDERDDRSSQEVMYAIGEVPKDALPTGDGCDHPHVYFVDQPDATGMDGPEAPRQEVVEFPELSLQGGQTAKERQEAAKELEFQIENARGEIEELVAEWSVRNRRKREEVEGAKKAVLVAQKTDLLQLMESEELRHRQASEEHQADLRAKEADREALTAEYERRAMELYAQQDRLDAEYLKEVADRTKEAQLLALAAQTRQDEIEAAGKERVQAAKQRFTAVQTQLGEVQKRFTEMLRQVQTEQEADWTQKRRIMEERLALERRKTDEEKLTNTKLFKEGQKHRQRRFQLENLIDDSRRQNDAMRSDAEQLAMVAERIATELAAQETEIKAKETTLAGIKRTNELLTSKRSVLGFLVDGFEVQIARLEEYLAYLGRNLADVTKELFEAADGTQRGDGCRTQLRERLEETGQAVRDQTQTFGNLLRLCDKLLADFVGVCRDHSVGDQALKDRLDELVASQECRVVTSYLEDKGRLQVRARSAPRPPVAVKAPRTQLTLPALLAHPSKENLTACGPQTLVCLPHDLAPAKYTRELRNLRTKFKKKLAESQEKYTELIRMRQVGLHSVHVQGASLIRQSNQLKDDRARCYQNILQQKNEVDHQAMLRERRLAPVLAVRPVNREPEDPKPAPIDPKKWQRSRNGASLPAMQRPIQPDVAPTPATILAAARQRLKAVLPSADFIADDWEG